jgi:hypothetical protein
MANVMVYMWIFESENILNWIVVNILLIYLYSSARNIRFIMYI